MEKKILQTGLLLSLSIVLLSCSSTKKTADQAGLDELEISEAEKLYFETEDAEPVEIADEETEYEIIILEPGFNVWLQSIARPPGYYSQSFLESRNQILVVNWNQRVLQPFRFDPNLYLMQIDYDPFIDYGYEVNYKLYYYFIFFQRRYNQRLGPFIPRI